MTLKPRPCVYAVSSRKRLAPGARTYAAELRAFTAWVGEIVDAQIDVLQIRELDLPARDLRDLVREVVRMAAGSATSIVVNDRADVAAVAAAAGVHLPARGLPAASVRRGAGDWLVGRSVHDADDAAPTEAVDYVIYGTVFPSRSKADASYEPAGLHGLAQAVRRWTCPVIAIGGITAERIHACLDQGAAGIAAIALFLPGGVEPESLGPAEAARAIRDAAPTNTPDARR